MKVAMVLFAILLSSAPSACSEEWLHRYPDGTECVIFTKSGDAFRAVVVGESWGYRGVLLNIILPGGLILDIYREDIDHVEIGSDAEIQNVDPIVQIPCGSPVYEFQGRYYKFEEFAKSYLSLVEAMVSSRQGDVKLKEYEDDYRSRVRVGQVIAWSGMVPVAGGLAWAVYALIHGSAIQDPGWMVGHLFLGLGIALGGSALGGFGEGHAGTPTAAVNYYNEAYRKREQHRCCGEQVLSSPAIAVHLCGCRSDDYGR